VIGASCTLNKKDYDHQSDKMDYKIGRFIINVGTFKISIREHVKNQVRRDGSFDTYPLGLC
jgi:hypothetical protein